MTQHPEVADPNTRAILDNTLAYIDGGFREWVTAFRKLAAQHGGPEPGEDTADYYWQLGKSPDGAFRATLLRRMEPENMLMDNTL